MAAYSNYELQPLSYYNGYFFGCLQSSAVLGVFTISLLFIRTTLSIGNQRCQSCNPYYCCCCFHCIICTAVIVIVNGAGYRAWTGNRAWHWFWTWSWSFGHCHWLLGLHWACLGKLVVPLISLGNLEVPLVVHPVFYSGFCEIPVVVLCHHLCRNEQHAHHHCENHHLFHNCKFKWLVFSV